MAYRNFNNYNSEALFSRVKFPVRTMHLYLKRAQITHNLFK